MKKTALILTTALALCAGHYSIGAVPQSVSYQGKLVVGNTNYQGSAYFKFVVANGAGNVTYWSNDGTSSGGQLPVTGVELTVVNGLFSVGLGDTRVVNMTPLPSSAFSNPDAQLRVWFSTQPNSGYQLLSPDQVLRSVPFAHAAERADRVSAGAIGNLELANGSVESAKIADGSIRDVDLGSGSVVESKLGTAAVNERALASGSVTGSKLAEGSVSEGKLANDVITSAKIRDGNVTAADLADHAVSHVKIAPRSVGGDRLGVGAITGTEIADGSIPPHKLQPGAVTSDHLGPISRLTAPDGSPSALVADNDGNLTFNAAFFSSPNRLHFQSGENLYLNPFQGTVFVGGGGGPGTMNVIGTLSVNGGNATGGGINIGDDGGFYDLNDGFVTYKPLCCTQGLKVDAPLTVANTIDLKGSTDSYAARLTTRGNDLLYIAGVTELRVGNPDNGNYRDVRARRFITQGADVAENFDVLGEAHPGHVVSIDPEGDGRLRRSATEYDGSVAGIVSGAGGIDPGVILSQEGTLADGDTSVTVNGRVYCWCDASEGEIKPGDLLTTSPIPGHAMKATDKVRAIGATVGKALTGLKEGRGLVLVLVATR